ncbi:Short chain dehydrogenase citE like protein [Verticillium longisporum]|uniref:Short chain dehydrogenase citE like protein n=1 Tax=Verticillium longisporum TaxID=100787 RepID=A0A8I2ZQX2_VERLO|nr:Short chain dehydrogenase citE like protein [Verticillium longisporum]KAG7124982.1 Short chain dehydrogenase citE like protein [Verticillium longisporum]KAG7135035.1 Short chain dehydrogenase citE like protein [Verticillium longisporum]
MSEPKDSVVDIGDKVIISAPAGVKTIHKTTYPTISATRPELSQAGKTILVTGGSVGIGQGIVRSYAEASASRIIVTGRRRSALEKTTSGLAAEFPKTEFIARVSDVASLDDTAALWSGIAAQGITVDVLVLSAAAVGGPGALISSSLDTVWAEYVTNVRSQLDFVQRFRAQKGFEDKKKYLVFITTAVIHTPGIDKAMPSYYLTKQASHSLIQTLADASNPKSLQINLVHPGLIYSEAAIKAGMTSDSLPFDDIKLPADYSVWAATEEATFLHGKFAWAAWDVHELRSEESKKAFESNPHHLSIRLVGI